LSNAWEQELIEKISKWQKEMAHKIEALEEKFDKLMKLSDDYYKTDRTVIYDYANKIEALEKWREDLSTILTPEDAKSEVFVRENREKIEALESKFKAFIKAHYGLKNYTEVEGWLEQLEGKSNE